MPKPSTRKRFPKFIRSKLLFIFLLSQEIDSHHHLTYSHFQSNQGVTIAYRFSPIRAKETSISVHLLDRFRGIWNPQMAAPRISRRVLEFGVDSCSISMKAVGFQSAAVRFYTSSLSSGGGGEISGYATSRRMSGSSNGNRLFLVDTLALVRKLEAQGVPSKQAEAITAAITEVLNDSLENVAHSFVSKVEMQKIEVVQESNLSKFKSEVKSLQEHHFALLKRETEKLQADIDKMRNELRYEIDKVTAGQRLDLNLEKGRIRDELADQKAETTNLTNVLDREIHALRAQMEAAKYDVVKYCVGTLLAVGLAVVRIMM
ncbi:Coiled-coil domain-containing protein [Drosera capensis]